MSDIGILNNPSDLFLIALVFGSPGLVLGAVAGALAWRKRRWAGALLGAVIGFAAWLAAWMWMKDMI
jgi:Na+/proline symporter